MKVPVGLYSWAGFRLVALYFPDCLHFSWNRPNSNVRREHCLKLDPSFVLPPLASVVISLSECVDPLDMTMTRDRTRVEVESPLKKKGGKLRQGAYLFVRNTQRDMRKGEKRSNTRKNPLVRLYFSQARDDLSMSWRPPWTKDRTTGAGRELAQPTDRLTLRSGRANNIWAAPGCSLTHTPWERKKRERAKTTNQYYAALQVCVTRSLWNWANYSCSRPPLTLFLLTRTRALCQIANRLTFCAPYHSILVHVKSCWQPIAGH